MFHRSIRELFVEDGTTVPDHASKIANAGGKALSTTVVIKSVDQYVHYE